MLGGTGAAAGLHLVERPLGDRANRVRFTVDEEPGVRTLFSADREGEVVHVDDRVQATDDHHYASRNGACRRDQVR